MADTRWDEPLPDEVLYKDVRIKLEGEQDSQGIIELPLVATGPFEEESEIEDLDTPIKTRSQRKAE